MIPKMGHNDASQYSHFSSPLSHQSGSKQIHTPHPVGGALKSCLLNLQVPFLPFYSVLLLAVYLLRTLACVCYTLQGAPLLDGFVIGPWGWAAHCHPWDLQNLCSRQVLSLS